MTRNSAPSSGIRMRSTSVSFSPDGKTIASASLTRRSSCGVADFKMRALLGHAGGGINSSVSFARIKRLMLLSGHNTIATLSNVADGISLSQPSWGKRWGLSVKLQPRWPDAALEPVLTMPITLWNVAVGIGVGLLGASKGSISFRTPDSKTIDWLPG